jgi:hypothetical protein
MGRRLDAMGVATRWLSARQGDSGKELRRVYGEHGINMLPKNATFADGGTGVEAGLSIMLERMGQGRLKVFAHLHDWFEEFRLYHRDEARSSRSTMTSCALRDTL